MSRLGLVALVFGLLLAAQAWGEPRASFLHAPPSEATSGQSLRLEGSLISDGTIGEVIARFRVAGQSSFDTVAFELKYGDFYRAVIPADAVSGAALEYYIEAQSYDGDRIVVFASPKKPQKIPVVADKNGKKGKGALSSVDEETTPVAGKKAKTVAAAEDEEPPPPKKGKGKLVEVPVEESEPPPPPKKGKGKTVEVPVEEPEPPPTTKKGKGKLVDEPPPEDEPPPKKGKPKIIEVEAEEPPPKKKARADEEEIVDPPAKKSKSRPSDEEATDAPVAKKSKSKSADEEIVDPPAPKKKSRSEDEAAEEPAPRRAKAVADEGTDDGDARPSVKRKKVVADESEAEPEAAPPKRAAPKPRTPLDDELDMYASDVAGAIAQRIDPERRRNAWAPTVLTATQLRGLAVRYVHEALDLVPGITVSRDQAGFYRLAVRGGRSEAEILFMLNGQRLNNFYDARALANLPIDNVARIEVFRGPATADIGLGNYLAAINIVTNTSEGFRASASGGAYTTLDAHLSAAKRFGDVKLHADADVASQVGYRRLIVRDVTDTNNANPATDRFTNDRRLLVNVGAGVSYEGQAVGQLGAQLRVIHENRGALIGLYDAAGRDSNLSWTVVQAQGGWSKELFEKGVLSIRASYDQQNTLRLWQIRRADHQERASDPETIFPEGVLEEQRYGVRAFGLAAKLEASLPYNNELRVGAAFETQGLFEASQRINYDPVTRKYVGQLQASDALMPTVSPTGGKSPVADRLNINFYGQDAFTPLPWLTLTGGIRVDLTQLPSLDATGAIRGARFVPSAGPRVGVNVLPTPWLMFRLLYGGAYRAPTPAEYADPVPVSDFNQGRYVGNLSAEGTFVHSVELGFEYVQAVGEAKLTLTGQAFYQRYDRALSGIDLAGGFPTVRNRPQGTHAFGAEGEAKLKLTSRAGAFLNASWFRGEDLAIFAQARMITDVPQARLNAGFTLPLGRWLTFDVTFRYASERRNNTRSVLELVRRFVLPAYTVVNAQLRTELLFEHLELSVLGQNVFNMEFADDAARPDRLTGGVPRELWLVMGGARLVF